MPARNPVTGRRRRNLSARNHDSALTDHDLVAALREAVPDGVRDGAVDRYAYATDASHYRLVPQVIVSPASAEKLAAAVSVAARFEAPVTFRSGGTSLSGQALGEGVVLDTRRHFRAVEVLDAGRRVRVQPGATLQQVNRRLAPHGAKLGPDPASEVACTIGGVVANNSSGMTCGTESNAYRTLDSLVLVLPSGTVVDTGAEDADEHLRVSEPALFEGLVRLRERVRGNPDSMLRIEQQYALKNTMGYSLNAFVDRDSPARILEGLVVGSEGTLAFIAEATFRTLPLRPHLATSLLVFDDLAHANDALPSLISAHLAAIELLDATALRVAQQSASAPQLLQALAVDQQAALLVEHQEHSAEALEDRVRKTSGLLDELLTNSARLTTNPSIRSSLWGIRKGLYAAVAEARPAGTSALLEDIAVQPSDLAEVCSELQRLFARHGYDDSVIFGHARDGNIHFMLTERFDDPGRTATYEAFTEDMVALVLGHGGTLKAEHGTGRMMAPFVRRQFGDELFEVMVELKALCDPKEVLNPGVILNDDPRIHVQDIKPLVAVEEEVDRCVACGFCEPVCPSLDLTLTPRQRITLRRELVLAEAADEDQLVADLRAGYAHDGIQTCAVDGMCQTTCPVGINTGDLIRRLRAEQAGRFTSRVWEFAAGHWAAATRLLAGGLTVGARLPTVLPRAASSAGRALLGDEVVPAWDEQLPAGGPRRRSRPNPQAEALFLPSCTGELFGPSAGGSGASAAFLRLCDHAGIAVKVPEEIASLCCGMPWKSKGQLTGYERMRHRVRESLETASEGWDAKVVVDATSCTEGYRELLADSTIGSTSIMDAVTFVRQRVVDRITIAKRPGTLALHPTCSAIRLDMTDDLMAIAGLCSEHVAVSGDWSCCAFAGDRGLLHPELTESATAIYAADVQASDAVLFASANRTCEIGMSRAVGQPYQHLLEILDASCITPSTAAISSDEQPG